MISQSYQICLDTFLFCEELINFYGHKNNGLFLLIASFVWFYTGFPIDKVAMLDQETRNYVGCKLLELTIKELFVFRFMQACFFYTFCKIPK
jgi:hypothetical protein